MTFDFIYEEDYSRLIPAIEIDARAQNPTIKNQIGAVIKAYTDSIVASISQNMMVYKIESDSVLAGYWVLEFINSTATVYRLTVRPAYLQYLNQINQIISNFINSNEWQGDFLN